MHNVIMNKYVMSSGTGQPAGENISRRGQKKKTPVIRLENTQREYHEIHAQ